MRETEDLICRKIKGLRKQRGLTLKDLSERTELSVSFLSQVERGVSSMTLVSMGKIAHALGVPMNELVNVNEESTYVNRTDSQIIMRLGKNYKGFVRLSGKFPGRKLEGVMLIMDPHMEDSEVSSHDGEEIYYVVKGRATFILNDEEYWVGTGESIHYPSTVRHQILNREDEELMLMCVITPAIF